MFEIINFYFLNIKYVTFSMWEENCQGQVSKMKKKESRRNLSSSQFGCCQSTNAGFIREQWKKQPTFRYPPQSQSSFCILHSKSRREFIFQIFMKILFATDTASVDVYAMLRLVLWLSDYLQIRGQHLRRCNLLR